MSNKKSETDGIFTNFHSDGKTGTGGPLDPANKD
jgi:hypothetical protein